MKTIALIVLLLIIAVGTTAVWLRRIPTSNTRLVTTTAMPSPTVVSTPVWNVTDTLLRGIRICYPLGWAATPSGPDQVALAPTGKSTDPDLEYLADILVHKIPMREATDLRSFYRTVADIDLFQNSGSHIAHTVNGYHAVTFHDVSGMLWSDVAAIQKGTVVIEITDVAQLHRTDGIFDQIVNCTQ
jgi:hypothetical protein